MIHPQISQRMLLWRKLTAFIVTSGYLVEEVVEVRETLVCNLRLLNLLLFSLRPYGFIVGLELLHDPYHHVVTLTKVGIKVTAATNRPSGQTRQILLVA